MSLDPAGLEVRLSLSKMLPRSNYVIVLCLAYLMECLRDGSCTWSLGGAKQWKGAQSYDRVRGARMCDLLDNSYCASLTAF